MTADNSATEQEAFLSWLRCKSFYIKRIWNGTKEEMGHIPTGTSEMLDYLINQPHSYTDWQQDNSIFTEYKRIDEDA